MLTAMCEGQTNRWEDHLPHVIFAMRTQRSTVTGSTPFRLVFGREASYPLDLLYAVPHPAPEEYPDYGSYALALQNRIATAHQWARNNIKGAIERQRRNYHADKKTFLPGERVWLYTPKKPVGVRSKFYVYWSGPWTIQSKVNDVVFRILPDPSWQRKGPEVVSIDRLKKYHENEADPNKSHPPPINLDLSLKHDEFCETLEPEGDDEEPVVPMEVEEAQAGALPAEARPAEPVPVPVLPPEDQVPPETQLPAPAKAEPLSAQERKAQQLALEAETAFGPLPEGRRQRR